VGSGPPILGINQYVAAQPLCARGASCVSQKRQIFYPADDTGLRLTQCRRWRAHQLRPAQRRDQCVVLIPAMLLS